MASLVAMVSSAQSINTAILDLNSTNWVVVPYAAYDTGTKSFGEGAAILYEATSNLWTGVRIQNLNHQQTTAGVQAQLQANLTIDGFKVHPFVEASTGMGNSSLYASAGTGAWVSFYSHTFNNKDTINIGLIGDYEHYVNGSIKGNQVNAGPLINIEW